MVGWLDGLLGLVGLCDCCGMVTSVLGADLIAHLCGAGSSTCLSRSIERERERERDWRIEDRGAG